MEKLTPKQRCFCDEYLIDLNATQAAIRAGYAVKYANTNAAKLLQITTIQDYISARMAEKESDLIASQDEVLKYLTSVMRKESISFVLARDDTGAERVIEKKPDEKEALKAGELLGKRYGIFVEPNEQQARIDKIKAETARIKGEEPDGNIPDDGFIDALQGQVPEVWQE